MIKKVKDDSRILNANKPFLITICVIFFLYSFTLIFPFLWLINNSVKAKMGFLNNPMSLASLSDLHFDNYLVMFTTFNLPKMFLNTLAMCLILPTVSIFMSNMAAYAVAKCKFIGKRLCYFLAMVNIFVHISGTLPVLYKLMTDLGLIDSLFGIVIMGAGGLNFQFLIFHGIYSNISKEYKEAAEIDGCTFFQTYYRIIVPLLKPVLATLCVLSFNGTWNDYLMPSIFTMSRPDQRPLIAGIVALKNTDQGAASWNLMLAGSTVSIIPVLIVYIFANKYIIGGLATGAVKG